MSETVPNIHERVIELIETVNRLEREIAVLRKQVTSLTPGASLGEKILTSIKLNPKLPGTRSSFIGLDKSSVNVYFYRNLTTEEHQILKDMGLQANATVYEDNYTISQIEVPS